MEPLCKSTSCAYGLLPNLECLSPEESIVDRLHQMAGKAEEILGESMERKKPLRLIR